ncbi:MAG: hypothetical protein ACOC4E_01420 [Patescibacteria group bacterium]
MAEEKDTNLHIKRLSDDQRYYHYVFKKTEKLVSVILYILSETKTDKKTEVHLGLIKDQALQTHQESLETLRLQPHEQIAGLETFRYRLVALGSVLSVAMTARVLPADLYQVLYEQLDSIERYLTNHYLRPSGPTLAELTETVVPKEGAGQAGADSTTPRRVAATKSAAGSQSRQRRVTIPSGDISSDAYLVYSQLTDRAERIKTVLEAKPQATVKDIAEVVTDVSEKTIQRELNSLIEKGQVVREGERRWSRYSVAKN